MGEDLPILKGILNGVVKYHNARMYFRCFLIIFQHFYNVFIHNYLQVGTMEDNSSATSTYIYIPTKVRGKNTYISSIREIKNFCFRTETVYKQ